MSGTEWLRALARSPLPRVEAVASAPDDDGRTRIAHIRPPDPAHAFAKATTRLMTDPYSRIERTGGHPRRARGSNRDPHDGSGADTGAVPWYVPEGAVFDAEMGKGWIGYHNVGGFNLGIGSWRHVEQDELSLDEIEDLTAVYHDEVEDWAEYDHAPIRPTIRAGGWADRDLDVHFEADVDGWVDHLIEYADWAFTGDEPNYDRIALLERAYRDDELVPVAAVWVRGRARLAEERRERLVAEERERLQAAAEVRYRLRTGSGPRKAYEAAKDPSSAHEGALPPAGHNGAAPARTAGLPTDDDGRIDPDAWKALWA